jgi:predicted GNAT family acetyltransferase
LYATTNIDYSFCSLHGKDASGTAFGQIKFLHQTKPMVIQHKLDGSKGVFFIPDEDGEILAEIVYLKREPQSMIIEHTEVADELRGQNIGYQLVHAAVEYARSHQMKVVPLCPFAKAVIDKKPEFRDVLAG